MPKALHPDFAGHMYDSEIWGFLDCLTEDTCRFLKSRLFQENRMLISNYQPIPYIEDDLLKKSVGHRYSGQGNFKGSLSESKIKVVVD